MTPATLAGAFAQVSGQALAEAVRARGEGFHRLTRDDLIGLAVTVRHKMPGASPFDAEDAVQTALTELIEKPPEELDDGRVGGFVVSRARYALLHSFADRERCLSLDALVVANSPSLRTARPVRPLPPDRPSSRREQILAALRAWADIHGRSPTKRECDGRCDPPLPAASTIRHHFGTFNAALDAAGLALARDRRREKWTRDEAIEALDSFRRRQGDWPSWVDLRRRENGLPDRGTLYRLFGTGSARKVGAIVEREESSV